MTAASFDASSSVARTAYIPPPRIHPNRDFLQTTTPYRNPIPYASATLGRLSQQQVPLFPSYSPYNAPHRRLFPLPNENFHRQQPPAIPYGPLINPYHIPPSSTYKSNSLPRRRIQSEILPARTVKWRNDVIENEDDPLYTDRSAFSDIGVITSPRVPRRHDITIRGGCLANKNFMSLQIQFHLLEPHTVRQT